MKKLFFVLMAGFFASFFVAQNPSTAKAAESESEILSRLNDRCYSQAKTEFDKKMTGLSGSAVERLDVSQFEEFAQMFGANPEGLDALKNMVEGLIPGMKIRIKEDLVAFSQINVDLTSCYEKELADNPNLLQNAKKLSAEAQKQLNLAQNFNYDALFTTGQKATSLVSVGAKERKVFRLLTFCLDGDRPAPNIGQNYYLAGQADKVKEGLSSMVRSAQTGNINIIQENIWKNKIGTTKETSSVSPPVKTSNRNLSLGLIGAGGIGFLIILILGIARLKTFSLLGKILWPIGLVGTVAVAGFGAVQIKGGDNNFLPSIAGPATLQQSFTKGNLTISAISPGAITSLDLIVQNNTKKTIEVDTAGIYFIPNSDNKTDFSSNNSSSEESDGNSDNKINRSQRLASAGSTGDGPPYPPPPPDPDKVLEDLSKKTDDALKKALEDLKNNPSEETLKDAVEKLRDCQLVGCPSGDTALDEMAKDFQPKIDKDTQAYKENPSVENKRELIKSTELGQAVGSDTSAAEGALGF